MTTNEPPVGAAGTLDDVNIADNEVSFFDILVSAPDDNGNISTVERLDGSLKVAVTEQQETPLQPDDQPFDVSAERVPVDIEAATASEVGVAMVNAGEVFDQSATPGSYAEVDLGPVRKFFDVYYSVGTEEGDIIVEVSADDMNWREHTVLSGADGDINTDGQMLQMTTTYQHVRAKASDDFEDDSVQVVEIVSKGV